LSLAKSYETISIVLFYLYRKGREWVFCIIHNISIKL
jgi:hypothetical protein